MDMRPRRITTNPFAIFERNKENLCHTITSILYLRWFTIFYKNFFLNTPLIEMEEEAEF